MIDLPENEIEEIAERLAFPALLTNAASAASSLGKELPSFKNWKTSQWTFHLDEVPSLAIYAIWLATNEQPLHAYLGKWKNIKPFTSGDDLKQLGLEPGPKYKEIINHLRAAWLDGELNSEEEEKKLRNRLITE